MADFGAHFQFQAGNVSGHQSVLGVKIALPRLLVIKLTPATSWLPIMRC
jgi:hypothetical protein